MNPNEELSCFWSSCNNEGICLPGRSKSYESLVSRAEVQKDSLSLIRLVENTQTKPHLCSSQLLIGQSSRENSYQLPAHSFDGDSWDLNQRRLQYNENFETNFSVSQPPLLLPKVSVPPCCYFQSSSSEKDSFSHSLQVPYHNYELFPDSENVFQIIWKLATNTDDQTSYCRKRLPCFINITNKTEVHSPTVSSQAGSPVYWTDVDVNQSKDHRQLIDFPNMNTKAVSPICLSDLDVNQLNKMPIKIFSEPKNSFHNEVQVDSPMFSTAGSPQHWTVSDFNLAKNIEQMIDFLTKATQAGSPLTDSNVNQTKNLQLIDPPTMTGQAGSPVRFIYPPTMTGQAGSPVRFIYPPTMTGQASSPVRLIGPDVNQQATNLQQDIFKSNLLYKTELCRNFLKGRCRKGDTCQFAHGHNDLRDIERHPLFKTRVCINFFKFGFCRFADRCMFFHLPNPNSSQPYNIGSDGEASPRSSYSSSPPNRKSFDLGAFMAKKGC